MPRPSKVISGGQTGADRAALDWAIAHGVPHGGWCPKGRWAEDGPLPARYDLQETPSTDPAQRTEWNVRDSDATIIFSLSPTLTGGTLLTAQFARQYGKPWLHLHRDNAVTDPVLALESFLQQHPEIQTLNLAGPRESEEPGIGLVVQRVLDCMLENAREPG